MTTCPFDGHHCSTVGGCVYPCQPPRVPAVKPQRRWWPRGKHNGQRIVGVRFTVAVDVTYWRLLWGSVRDGRCWIVGPVRVWLAGEYEQ